MIGPHPMSVAFVTLAPTKPGAYILADNANRALYVGRSDANLRQQLLAHFVPANEAVAVVAKFWYQQTLGSLEAYTWECNWYHQYVPTHNFAHPLRPLGVLGGCPVCGR